jgi:hypothetical protein
MLSTNIDRTGRPFVSTFEAKSYPFCAHNTPPPPPSRLSPAHRPIGPSIYPHSCASGADCLSTANPDALSCIADGTQWHPEKNAFEWNPKESIPHSADAVGVMQWVANFFVSEARKNDHAFASVEAETEALIFNYATTFTNAGFTEEYIWPQPDGKW